jgi:probable selenium-dependent hydroxylase accessory protein YqeC
VDHAFLQPWHAFLPGEGGHLIGLFGGGGKTALMRALAAVYRERDRPVILTTTTCSEPLDWPELRSVVWSGGPPPTLAAADALPFVHAGPGEDGKWHGLAPSDVDRLGARHDEAVLIVEVDGSAGRPVKLHRSDEPLWPDRTSLGIAVLGLAALDAPTASVLHRYGRETRPWLAGSDGRTLWDWSCCHRLLTGPDGYLSRLPEGVPPLVALLQLDSLDDSLGLLAFVGRLLEEDHVPLVVLGELSDGPRLRTLYRTAGPGERHGR